MPAFITLSEGSLCRAVSCADRFECGPWERSSLIQDGVKRLCLISKTEVIEQITKALHHGALEGSGKACQLVRNDLRAEITEDSRNIVQPGSGVPVAEQIEHRQL